MTYVDMHRLPMEDPGDVSAIEDAIAAGTIDPAQVVGIISQPEGSGHARALTMLELSLLLGRHLDQTTDEVVARIPMMMIGLCGGLMSPHHTIITRSDDGDRVATGDARLVVGVGASRDLDPAELGTLAQVDLAADAVLAAIADAGLTPDEVACVEIKCPAMTPQRAAGIDSLPGGSLGGATSMAKAAAALGIAVALGEVDRKAISASSINRDRSLYTNRGSVSAGGEHTACRVLVFGNSTTSTSSLRVGAGVMDDQLDVGGVLRALGDAGMREPAMPLGPSDAAKVKQVFINCGADLTSEVRGRRHTINSDFLAGHAGIIAKAVANAVVASVVGDPMILASAGAEHQGAPGTNLIAVFVEADR